MPHLPHREELFKPLLQALRDLGGSASVEELRERVIQNMRLSDDVVNVPHNSKRATPDGRTELEYQLAWVRTSLKQMGYIDNSERGIWRLIKSPTEFKSLEKLELSQGSKQLQIENGDSIWKSQLSQFLQEKLSPDAFERLIQRVLRETGFVQVEVTGKSGDGGIDGKGIAKINGILSFHVVFQCKRYKGAVSASLIRDFRGAMQGRADKGLFITTGYFTRDALKEAVREGAIAIDLVDGEKLAEKLKELRLGVKVETVERICVEPEWFKEL